MAAELAFPRPVREVADLVDCCYCGVRQRTRAPPAVAVCANKRCGRTFTVVRNVSGKPPITMGEAAKRYFTKQRRKP